MPFILLSEEQGETVPAFSVCGTVVPKSRYVDHLAISTIETRDVRKTTEFEVAHVCPPLTREKYAFDFFFRANLSDEQTLKLGRFIANVEFERYDGTSYDYYVVQPEKIAPDAPGGLPKYSCVGFVIAAFRSAGIEILETDRTNFPRYTLEDFKSLNPSFYIKLKKHPEIARQIGLDRESEPWQITHPGFAARGLCRFEETGQGKYLPKKGDELLPENE